MINKYVLSQDAKNYIKKYVILLVSILIILILFQRFKAIILTLLLISIGIISIFWKRFIQLSLGFELITFITIIFCFAFSPLFAMLAATTMLIIGSILNGRLCIPMFIQIAAYFIICLLSFLLLGLNVSIAGIILTLVFNLVIHTTYILALGFNPINSIISFTLNMLINLFLFTHFAERVLSML